MRNEMDVKEAVASAKAYVNDIFKDQIYSEPALEEVEFDDGSHVWKITIGFLRQPEVLLGETPGLGNPDPKSTGRGLGAVPPFAMPRRAYKVVRIRAGKIVSVRDRD